MDDVSISSPFGVMCPPRRRKPLPEQPPECSACGSGNVDIERRYCSDCDTYLPHGASVRRPVRKVTTRSMRVTEADELQRRHQHGR